MDNPVQIAALKDTNPEAYWKLVQELAALPEDEWQEQRKAGLRLQAGAGSGQKEFEAYYELIHGNKLTAHNEVALEECYRAHDEGRIFLYLGSRKFRKTTTFDITFASFMIAHYPEETSIVTGASDPNAKLIAKSIAQIVENHPEFKAVFPYIVPYKERGWGAEGYWVRRTHKLDGDKWTPVSIQEWTRGQAKTNDPTFVGGGYKSAEINGKHPTLLMIVDDLHDIDSSASVTEREYIKKVFFYQILPTAIQEGDKLKTWVIMTGVPFAKDDTYGVLHETGQCVFVKVPCMKKAPDEADGAVYLDGVNKEKNVIYDDIVGWWYLTWPEEFGEQSIITNRSYGKAAFWQMYMMDIETAKTGSLIYYLYDHKDISYEWPAVGGADPTNVEPDKEVGGDKRSSFALCYLAKTPQGGAVVVDGFLKACGIVEAKDAILQAQTMFRNWRTTGVENTGGGAVFLQYLRTDAKVRCQDSNLSNPNKKGIADKKTRFMTQTHPWLENAVIRISDMETPYNMALRRLCDNFFDLDTKDPSMDAGDALYHAAKLIPEILRVPVKDNIAPHAMQDRGSLAHPMAGGKVTHGDGIWLT